ncbi:MAG TPA: hypothetical protein PLR64_03050, partial [Candidatus Dojkabacteria bacterium]|nr:hypothetical protein [Candidatus Dojkabacteria bacterium]
MTAELNKALQERIAIKSKLKESTTKEGKEVFSEMLKKNTAYIANIRNAAQLNISQSALLMDYEKGDDNLTTFNMTIANLEKARDAAKNGDVKVLEEMGLNDKDDLNSIADNMDDIIKDANRYKDNMLNNLKMQYKVNGRDDFWAAEKMAEKQMEIQKNEDVISETEKGFDEIVDGMFNSVQGVDNTWQKQFFKDATLLQAIKQSPEIREQYTEEEITQLEDNVKQKLEGKGFKQQAKRIYNTISQGAIANVEKIHAFQSKNIKLQEEADKYLNEKEVKQRKKDEIKNRINEYKKETDIDKLKKYKERLEEKYVQDAYESTEELEKIGQEIDKRISLQTERNEKFAREQAAAANAKKEAAEKAARDKANGIETPDEKSPEELAKEAAT